MYLLPFEREKIDKAFAELSKIRQQLREIEARIFILEKKKNDTHRNKERAI